MDDREWKTQENIDEMLRDPDEIAVDIEKNVYMWPGIEAEFLAEDESEQAENEEDNDPEPSKEEEKKETKSRNVF